MGTERPFSYHKTILDYLPFNNLCLLVSFMRQMGQKEMICSSPLSWTCWVISPQPSEKHLLVVFKIITTVALGYLPQNLSGWEFLPVVGQEIWVLGNFRLFSSVPKENIPLYSLAINQNIVLSCLSYLPWVRMKNIPDKGRPLRPFYVSMLPNSGSYHITFPLVRPYLYTVKIIVENSNF